MANYNSTGKQLLYSLLPALPLDAKSSVGADAIWGTIGICATPSGGEVNATHAGRYPGQMVIDVGSGRWYKLTKAGIAPFYFYDYADNRRMFHYTNFISGPYSVLGTAVTQGKFYQDDIALDKAKGDMWIYNGGTSNTDADYTKIFSFASIVSANIVGTANQIEIEAGIGPDEGKYRIGLVDNVAIDGSLYVAGGGISTDGDFVVGTATPGDDMRANLLSALFIENDPQVAIGDSSALATLWVHGIAVIDKAVVSVTEGTPDLYKIDFTKSNIIHVDIESSGTITIETGKKPILDATYVILFRVDGGGPYTITFDVNTFYFPSGTNVVTMVEDETYAWTGICAPTVEVTPKEMLYGNVDFASKNLTI